MLKRQKQQPAAGKSVLQEYDQAGRHRIIVVENGVPDASPWFEHYQIATHRGLYAVTPTITAINAGVFRVNPVAHQVMRGAA